MFSEKRIGITLSPRRRLRLKGLVNKRLQFGFDLAVLSLAFLAANLLRFDFNIPPAEIPDILTQLPFVVLLQFIVLARAGVYTFIWRYVGMAEVKTFLVAAACSAIPLLLLRIWLPDSLQQWRVPVSVNIIDTLLAFGGVAGLRVLRRATYERFEKQHKAARSTHQSKKPVLLIGAGRAGVLAAREIRNRGDMDLDVKGFVDDDPVKQGSVVHGVRVLGTTDDLPRLVRELDIDHVIISIAQASRQSFRRIIETCERVPVRVQIIPGLYELLQGHVQVNRVRDVQIEDLLGREPVRLDEVEVERLLTGRCVMITGAGGSIGSELSQQVARFHPAVLLLVERAECALFTIHQELSANWPNLSIVPLIADIGDEARIRSILATYRPQIIFHAAAHKHVPMMEFNPAEAIKNNVLATKTLGEQAGELGVETFVLISTDKAVRPTSVMGASKRLAEVVIQDLDGRYPTRYLAVRFGNVIGSNGSVVQIFREQIKKGGPLTVTHPGMVRYFMTIPEAAQLVLQAGAMGEGGEIFILDMGEPVRILDLAKEIITLSGLKPYDDIDIVITGIRPGEKLFEELETTSEHIEKTRHPKIYLGKIAAYPEERVRWALENISDLAQNGQTELLRDALNEILPEAALKNTAEGIPGPILPTGVIAPAAPQLQAHTT